MTALITEPLSGEAPSGCDARYDDAYLLIEAEIDKAGSMTGGAVTDWRVIHDAGETLLAQQSKDLKLAAWWVFSRYKLSGFEGLADALQVLNVLLERFAETLFPRSPKGRFNALMWLETGLEKELHAEQGLAIPLPQSDRFLEQFRALQAHVKTVCGTEELLFRELCRRLETAVVQERARKETETRSKSVATAPSAGQELPEELATDADAAKLLNQLKKSAGLLSGYWRGRAMEDLRAMRLVRMVSWLETEGLPEAQNQKTALNPPSVERVERIEMLTEEGQYGEALELVENMLLRSPFWLEGHLFAFRILEAAGKTACAAELKHLVAAFVNAREGITELTFRDATPFAPAAVKTWLSDAAGGAKSAPSAAETQEDRFEAVGQECYALLKKKKEKEAMQKLHAAYAAAGSGEEKFRWRLLHAEVAVEAGKPQMALALIEELENEVERYRLDAWRPDLAARVYTLLLNSFNRTQIEREKRDAAYQRLCRIDTAGAIDIKLH